MREFESQISDSRMVYEVSFGSVGKREGAHCGSPFFVVRDLMFYKTGQEEYNY